MSVSNYDCLKDNIKTPFGDNVPPGEKPPLTYYVKQGNSGHFAQPVVGSATAYDMQWLWPGHIPMDRVTLFEGPAGAGKSFVVLDLIARFTSDRPWPDGTPQAQPGGKVLILNRQDHRADVVGARLKSLGAVHDRFTHFLEFNTSDEKSWHFSHRSVSLPLDIPAIEKVLAADEAIRLIVIDPVSDFCSSKKQLGEAIHALNRLAALRKVAIVVTLRANAKFNRDGELVVKNKFDTDAARCQWCCVPDPEEPGRNLFMPTLMNYSALPAGRTYRLGNLNITWDEKTVDPRRPLKSELDCARWLRDLMQKGDLPATEVKRLGKELGFSESKINRTRKEIGVQIYPGKAQGRPKSMWTIKPLSQSASVLPDFTVSDSKAADSLDDKGDMNGTAGPEDEADDDAEVEIEEEDEEEDEVPLTDEQMIDEGLGHLVLEERLSKLPEDLRDVLMHRLNSRILLKSEAEQAEFYRFVLARCPSEFGLPPEMLEAIENPLDTGVADARVEEVEEVEEVEKVKGVKGVKGEDEVARVDEGETGRATRKVAGARKLATQGKSSTPSTPLTPSTSAMPAPYQSLTGKPLEPQMAEDIAGLLALFDQDEPPRKDNRPQPSSGDFVPGAFPATDAEVEEIVKGIRRD